MKRLIALILAPVILVVAPHAHAGGAGAMGGGATEFTQWLNNTELVKVAIDQAQTAATAVQQYQTQLQQYGLQQMNQVGLGGLPAGQAGDTMKTLQALGQYRQALQMVQGSLSTQVQLMDQRVVEARVGKMDWQSYLRRVADDVARGNGRAKARVQQEQAALEQVQADYDYARSVQAQIPATVGQHQSVQLLNSQMNRVVTQNAKMIEIMSASLSRDAQQSQAQAETQAQEAADRQRAKDVQDQIVRRQRAWSTQ